VLNVSIVHAAEIYNSLPQSAFYVSSTELSYNSPSTTTDRQCASQI